MVNLSTAMIFFFLSFLYVDMPDKEKTRFQWSGSLGKKEETSHRHSV